MFFLIFLLLALVVLCIFCHKKRGKLVLILRTDGLILKGDFSMATLTVAQFVGAELVAVDRKGNPASVEAGTVVITSSDEAVFTIERDPDNEMKFKIVSSGVGVAQLDYVADADLGDGVRTIAGFTAVEVQLEQAVGFGITLGEPQDK